MAEQRTSIHGQWSSRFAFILAATGSAVGLGNIWKFPYMAGENGGGAFVLVYIACIALVGLPIMMAEVMLGRRGRQSPINTMRTLAREEGRSGLWQYLGWGGVIAGFFILSYYSVIAGWTMAYFFRTIGGTFDGVTAEVAGQVFGNLVSDPERLLAWHTIFMVLTTVVVSRGVEHGLEKSVRFLMPALFIILILLVGYAMSQGAFMQGVHFLFDADFSKLSADVVLKAMGQAFFTLSLGMGAIMIYGSYLPSDASIARTTFTIVVMDTLVALLAGLAIFPIVFGNGMTADQGVGLIFKVLPIAFGQMPMGTVFGGLFFLLLLFAAWTSAISLIEPAAAWLVENHGMNRIYAAVACGMAAWLLGVGTVLSFNLWAEVTLFDKTFFDLMDYLTSNVMLPLGGLSIALFAGWAMSRNASQDELRLKLSYHLWRFLIRFVSPVLVALVFLNAIGVLSFGRG
ncbi:MAG: sodium-dependent transporter [Chromatiales bacterium]|nr:sodium-dependent transporter [Chromatiales bacterium]